MSKEQSHELTEQHQQQQQQQQAQSHYQPGQQQTIPTEPQPTHNHDQNTPAAEQLPPSYEEARASPGAPLAGPPPPANVAVTPLTHLGENPQWIDCPFCHKRTQTTVRREGGSMQIVVGAVLCFVCICLTCLPCLLHWFEDTEYHCSECKNKVAIRKNDGPIQVLGPTQVVYSQYGANGQMNPPQAPHPDASAQAQQRHPVQQQQQQQQYQQQQPLDIQPQPQQTQPTHPSDVKN